MNEVGLNKKGSAKTESFLQSRNALNFNLNHLRRSPDNNSDRTSPEPKGLSPTNVSSQLSESFLNSFNKYLGFRSSKVPVQTFSTEEKELIKIKSEPIIKLKAVPVKSQGSIINKPKETSHNESILPKEPVHRKRLAKMLSCPDTREIREVIILPFV